jgi:3D (Asp-Asp-Asp) domain-containing protein
MRLAASSWWKAIVTAVAIGGFVSAYEVTILDSRDVVSQKPQIELASGEEEAGPNLPFTATAYCKGLVTASGVPPQAGVAAADPALLPVGSIVELDSPEAQYDGVYSVLDTGPSVQGRKLDIYIWSCNEALRFGRQKVGVKVIRLGWTPSATTHQLLDRLLRLVDPSQPMSS